MQIHVVEDNPDMLESLRMLLELRGFRVKSYLRGLELLDAADRIGPDDVVISDYYMPDVNGVELLKRVRQVEPKVRALLLTGSREEGIVASARNLTKCGIVYKPLDVESLERAIYEVKAA